MNKKLKLKILIWKKIQLINKTYNNKIIHKLNKQKFYKIN